MEAFIALFALEGTDLTWDDPRTPHLARFISSEGDAKDLIKASFQLVEKVRVSFFLVLVVCSICFAGENVRTVPQTFVYDFLNNPGPLNSVIAVVYFGGCCMEEWCYLKGFVQDHPQYKQLDMKMNVIFSAIDICIHRTSLTYLISLSDIAFGSDQERYGNVLEIYVCSSDGLQEGQET